MVWGKLVRVGGSETSHLIPSLLNLSEDCIFLGRFAQPEATNLISDEHLSKSKAVPGKYGEIFLDGKRLFSHTSQVIIPCLFISATHFAIRIERNGSNIKCFLKDFSRNGTIVNNIPVGTDNEVEIRDNDEISIEFRTEKKLIYKFTKEALSLSLNGRDEFAEQIKTLLKENKSLEQKLEDSFLKTDILRDRLQMLENEIKESNAKNTELQDCINNLQEVNLAYEANKTAEMARIRNLDSELENMKQELMANKLKIHRQSEEIERKDAALRSREVLLEEVNNSLVIEKNLRQKFETELIQRNIDLSKKNNEFYEISHSFHEMQRLFQKELEQRKRLETLIHEYRCHNEQLQGVLSTRKCRMEDRLSAIQEWMNSLSGNIFSDLQKDNDILESTVALNHRSMECLASFLPCDSISTMILLPSKGFSTPENGRLMEERFHHDKSNSSSGSSSGSGSGSNLTTLSFNDARSLQKHQTVCDDFVADSIQVGENNNHGDHQADSLETQCFEIMDAEVSHSANSNNNNNQILVGQKRQLSSEVRQDFDINDEEIVLERSIIKEDDSTESRSSIVVPLGQSSLNDSKSPDSKSLIVSPSTSVSTLTSSTPNASISPSNDREDNNSTQENWNENNMEPTSALHSSTFGSQEVPIMNEIEPTNVTSNISDRHTSPCSSKSTSSGCAIENTNGEDVSPTKRRRLMDMQWSLWNAEVDEMERGQFNDSQSRKLNSDLSSTVDVDIDDDSSDASSIRKIDDGKDSIPLDDMETQATQDISWARQQY